MFQLLFLAGLITGVYALTGIKKNLSRSLRGRIALAVFFLFTASGHFIKTAEMAEMLPPSIPMRMEIIYITGVLEILGAIGILVPAYQRAAAWSLIAFLIAVLPSNIYAAVNHVDFGGHVYGFAYLLLRVPFQLFLIAWTYYFAIKLRPSSRTDAQIGTEVKANMRTGL